MKKIYLIVILLLALILRLWNISSNPPGLSWDEAALGYNAYSLLQTGRDEYGTILPINLKSFGDYKPAFYAYLDTPFITVFGLNELAVRLPSVLAGVLIVLLVYLLVQQLFKSYPLSLLSSFFVAVSPFAIQFSRPAFEASIALLLNILGVYLFVSGKQKLRLLSAIIFILSLVTYQSSRIFVPLVVLMLLWFYKKDVGIKKLIPVVVIFFCGFIMVLSVTFLTGQANRLATLNFFAYQRSSNEINTISQEDGLNVNSISFQVLHGEWWAYTRGLAERYLLYYSPKMLILDGDYDQRQRVPDIGPLYYFSFILIPLGLIYFLRQNSLGVKLLFGWLLLSPIPAVLSRDLLNLIRGFNLMFPLEVLQAGGLIFITGKLHSRKLIHKPALILIFIVFVINFLIFLDRYFVHAPKEYSQYWLYGYKQAINILNNQTNNKNYKHIVMTDYYGQPYIYYLFYNQYPPVKYQQQASLEQNSVDVGTVRKIDNIEFRHIYWPADRGVKNTLYIGTTEELPDKDIKPFSDYTILKDINFLDGQPAFRVVETK